MIDINGQGSAQTRLEDIERTLVEVYGLLGFLARDKSIPLHWHSQVQEKRNMIALAVLNIIAERKKAEMNNDAVEMVSYVDSADSA